MKLIPKTKTPDLALETVAHGAWRLSEQKPKSKTLLVFYRGDHCPLCKKQLQEFERMYDDFLKAGIEVVAISSNSKELASKSVAEWELSKLPVAYGLPIDEARNWGLFVSNGVKVTEPAQFTEPGYFVIEPDQTLYASMVQTMPFSRPSGRQLLNSLSFIIENDYPARGEAQ